MVLPLTQWSGTAPPPPTLLGFPEDPSAPLGASSIGRADPGPPELLLEIGEVEGSASYTRLGRPGVPASTGRVVAAASAQGIPATALAAYQRAEVIINVADTSCHLPWQLLAAIGRVESDHGRYGGSVLGTDGISRPGIYGPQLNGSHSTALIRDTDAGLYDRDRAFDRAVGPMQFIPSTWAVVGVDADGDSRRDPQDIDDGALAAAVYLCSGSDDLGTETGRRSSLYRYNHSSDYVEFVLSIMEAYLRGDYSAESTYTTSTIHDVDSSNGQHVAVASDHPPQPGSHDGGPTSPGHVVPPPPPPTNGDDDQPPDDPPDGPPGNPPAGEEPGTGDEPVGGLIPAPVCDLLDEVTDPIDLPLELPLDIDCLDGLPEEAGLLPSEFLFATCCGGRPAERRRTWE